MKIVNISRTPDEVIHKIGRKEYILIQEPVKSSKSTDNYLDKRLPEIGVIEQGIEKVFKPFLGEAVYIVRFLVPVKSLKKYRAIMEAII